MNRILGPLVEVQVISTALGQRIRELQAKKGYSQEAFADLCCVHRTFMGTVERGESNLHFNESTRQIQPPHGHFWIITWVDLMTTVTSSPALRCISSALRRVMMLLLSLSPT